MPMHSSTRGINHSCVCRGWEQLHCEHKTGGAAVPAQPSTAAQPQTSLPSSAQQQPACVHQHSVPQVLVGSSCNAGGATVPAGTTVSSSPVSEHPAWQCAAATRTPMRSSRHCTNHRCVQRGWGAAAPAGTTVSSSQASLPAAAAHMHSSCQPHVLAQGLGAAHAQGWWSSGARRHNHQQHTCGHQCSSLYQPHVLAQVLGAAAPASSSPASDRPALQRAAAACTPMRSSIHCTNHRCAGGAAAPAGTTVSSSSSGALLMPSHRLRCRVAASQSVCWTVVAPSHRIE